MTLLASHVNKREEFNNMLTSDQIVFLISAIEKQTGKKYYDLSHVKNHIIINILNHIDKNL